MKNLTLTILVLSLSLSLLPAAPATARYYDASYDQPTEACMLDVISMVGNNVRECKALRIFGICETCIKSVVVPCCQDGIDQCRALHADAIEVCDVSAETLCS
jgi:hypothetical protein